MRFLPQLTKTLAFAAAATIALGATTARADDDDATPPPPPPAQPPPPPPPPAPPPEAWPIPPNVHVGPGGDVNVTSTPLGGVDVHAQTQAGQVHAYGCSKVQVDPQATAAQPAAIPGSPGFIPCPPPAYYYPPPAYYAPQPYYVPPREYVKPKPKYAPDPTRTGALLASSLLFGIGTAGAGAAYMASALPARGLGCDLEDDCSKPADPSKPALYAMGGFLTVTPSIPRFVMGDIGVGVLLTGLRGGSFAVGALVDWKDKTYVVPVTFAFVVPLTLGIVDLATTPHREQMERRERDAAARDAKKVKLRSVGPSVAIDKRGAPVPTLSALASF